MPRKRKTQNIGTQIKKLTPKKAINPIVLGQIKAGNN